jgi:Spy/CpxP family protein refolding chaperone
MRKQGIWLGVAVLAVAAMAAAPSLIGAQPGIGRGAFAETPLGRLVTGQIGRALVLRSQLGVTDEQRDQIKEILRSRGPELAEVMGNITERKRALREAVLAEKPDERTIRARADELGRTIGQAAALGARLNQQLDPIWTERQRDLLREFRADKDQAVDTWLQEIASP